MQHYFDIEIATKYGINSAIILQNLAHWIKQNQANQTNFYDGEYWTFNSRRAYKELFPYLSERQINTAFEKLIENDLIKTGNYNKIAYDRTLWYALTQKGKCILHFDIMDADELQNRESQIVEPIPNDKHKINKNNNKIKSLIPTLEEVQAYAKEKGRQDLVDKFYEYYTLSNWVDKNNQPIKNWKNKFNAWIMNNKPQPKQSTNSRFRSPTVL